MRTIGMLTYTNPDSEKVVSDFMNRCGGTLEDFGVFLRKLGYSIPYEIRLLSGTNNHMVMGLHDGQMSIVLAFYKNPGEERKITIYHYGSSIDYYVKVLKSQEYGTVFEASTHQ
jgi:hypothetical protein